MAKRRARSFLKLGRVDGIADGHLLRIKVLAQGEQGPLKYFITLYSTTTNRMAGSKAILPKIVTAVSQDVSVSDEVLASSQEQSEVDDSIPDESESVTEIDESSQAPASVLPPPNAESVEAEKEASEVELSRL